MILGRAFLIAKALFSMPYFLSKDGGLIGGDCAEAEIIIVKKVHMCVLKELLTASLL